MNISLIMDFALDYNPALAMRDLSTVHMWMNEGCDIESDIMPTLKEITQRRGKTKKDKIGTFAYFTNSVRAARDKRLIEPFVQEKLREPSQAEKDALRAKNIIFCRKIGRYIPTYDEAFLQHYEQNREGN